MRVELEVRMSFKVMYSFMLHHYYTHLPGIMQTILGAAVLLLGLEQIRAESWTSAAALCVLAGFMLIYPLVRLRIRAKKRVESAPAFREPLHYELSDEGVKLVQEDTEKEYAWTDFQKASSTLQALVLYTGRSEAVILPRAQIGELWAMAAEMISTHMPPDKVKIRQVN